MLIEILLSIILIIVVIILAILGYASYQMRPVLGLIKEVENLNYSGIRPIATDMVRTVVLPELKVSFEKDIKDFITNLFKGGVKGGNQMPV
ncbi:MAG: hypothetical protein Harvfovirus1_16 [Harvfovirus sp.]|uniref:Uncharacterized protein n=1 Tax=Harvfovirus sp. TaxID=2487768 RepID=A0A3G5A2H2_9VIRU|nr:MAG: hypothetical protein Harvfovirus1_16 [Harvfovirus sp.]